LGKFSTAPVGAAAEIVGVLYEKNKGNTGIKQGREKFKKTAMETDSTTKLKKVKEQKISTKEGGQNRERGKGNHRTKVIKNAKTKSEGQGTTK